jgi:general secretion pathway protein A
LLRRSGLRQLNQRITARYHLEPFDARDTAAYVRHRLAVAGVDRPLFTRSALRRLHRISGGVPRLINILCDRALLGASVTQSPVVTRRILNRAAAEVRGGGASSTTPDWPTRAAVAAALSVLVVGGAWLGWTHGGRPDLAAPIAHLLHIGSSAPAAVEAGPAPDGDDVGDAGGTEQPRVALAQSVSEVPPPLGVEPLALMSDKLTAMRLLLRQWGVELGTLEAGRDPCARLESFGLSCESDMGGWSRLRDFDRPALLRLRDADGNEGYAALAALATERATLQLPEGAETFALAALDELWLGEYLIVWQSPPVGTSVIGPGSSGEAVRWLRKLVSRVPGLGIEDNGSGRFDEAMDAAIRRFQEQSGLGPDGIAGPRTLIRLHNAVNMPGPPRLRSEG